MRRSGGFTLLEVLIAISIFALIGLGGYRLLTTITDTHARVRVVVDDFSALGRAMTFIERDLYQIVPRGIRDEYGEPLPPLLAGIGIYPVEFTRSGWANPVGMPRSSMQRVAYSLDAENNLVRHFWLVLDRAEDSLPVDQVVLENVQDFQVTFFSAEGEASDAWPVSTGQSPLPAAIEILLATEATGEIRRLIPLVDAPTIALPVTDDIAGDGA